MKGLNGAVVNKNEYEGIVFNIQRYSVGDGPGIRTVVFLKGCPLRCKWCSNPESQKYEIELLRIPVNCKVCGECIQACPLGLITLINEKIVIDWEECDN